MSTTPLTPGTTVTARQPGCPAVTGVVVAHEGDLTLVRWSCDGFFDGTRTYVGRFLSTMVEVTR